MLEFKYFDSRLITEFVPERNNAPENSFALFMFCNFQYLDFAQAIHYAEDTILPSLLSARKNNFQSLKPEQIVTALKTLHQKGTKRLLSDMKCESGEFSQTTVLRWTKNMGMFDELSKAVYDNQDLVSVFAKYELKDIAEPFLALMEKIKNDPTIVENESARSHCKEERQAAETYLIDKKKTDKKRAKRAFTFSDAIRKMADAKHQKKLTPVEIALIEKVFKICPAPEEIPQLAQQFANDLIDKFKSCDGSLDEVVKIASFVYLTLSKEHYFPNGNGRIAALMMNLMLFTYGLPCILFRTREDKKNPNSRYNQVMNNMDENPALLFDYIKEKVEAALKEGPHLDSKEEWEFHNNIISQLKKAEGYSKLILNGIPEEKVELLAAMQTKPNVQPAKLEDYQTYVTGFTFKNLKITDDKHDIVLKNEKKQMNLLAPTTTSIKL